VLTGIFFVQNRKTQFTIFKNPVRQILQKPSYFPKTQFWKWQNSVFQKFSKSDGKFFLNYFGIWQGFAVYASFYTQICQIASKLKSFLEETDVHEHVFVLLDMFFKPNAANFAKTQLFSKNSVLKMQKPSSENAKTQFSRNI